MVKIEQKFIPEHRANRRAYAPGSAYYQVFRTMDYITIHDVGSDGYTSRNHDPYWFHRYIAEHPSTENPPNSRKAWHLTIGSEVAIQHLRFDEIGLHSGEGVFAGVLNGNTNSIGIEKCRSSNPEVMDKIIDNTAWVCAWLIFKGHVGKPYPECLRTHQSWSGKYCPAVLLSRPNGWQDFVDQVGEHLAVMEGTEQKPEEPKSYRVIAASNTDYKLSLAGLKKAKKAFPTLTPFIKLNEHNNEKYYRVVLDELDRLDAARVLTAKAKERLGSGWIVSEWEDIPFDKPEPKPEPEPPPEVPQPELPSGLMELLKKLFEILQKLFGKEGS